MRIEGYLSKQKAAQRLDVSERTVDRLRGTGELHWIRVGSRVRIEIASLEAYEARQWRLAKPSVPDDLFAIPALTALRATRANRGHTSTSEAE